MCGIGVEWVGRGCLGNVRRGRLGPVGLMASYFYEFMIDWFSICLGRL